MDLSGIYHRIIRIAEIVYDHPLIYLPLIGAWLITELYFIINSDDVHGHTYVMSTGITLIFTSYMISPFALGPDSTYFGQKHLALVLIIFLYGLFLVAAGIRRKFHPFLAEFFGSPGHSLIPGMMGILYIEHNIPFDKVTLLIIASPVLFLGTVKTLRRIGYRITARKEEKIQHCAAEAKNEQKTDVPKKSPFRLFGRIQHKRLTLRRKLRTDTNE